DEDGWAISGAGIEPRSLNVADRDYFREAVGSAQPAVSAGFISRLRNVPVVVLAAPVQFSSGGRGVLAVGLSLARLAGEVRGLAAKESVSIVVLDSQGQG